MTSSTLTNALLRRTVRFRRQPRNFRISSRAVLERYVRTIVDRYKNSPNIFAWELMNEARCLGDLPSGPNCVPGSDTLHTWYEQQANFVRSLCVCSLTSY
jgi:endo-1,4-beta-mannosidase